MKIHVLMDHRKSKFYEEGDRPFDLLEFDADKYPIFISDVPQGFKDMLNDLEDESEMLMTMPFDLTEDDIAAMNDWLQTNDLTDFNVISGDPIVTPKGKE